jgi:Fe-S-cluster containining protein
MTHGPFGELSPGSLTTHEGVPTSEYECDKCGACCKGHLIVECDSIDVLREPRLIDADRHHAGKQVRDVVREIDREMKAVIIACSTPCPFLGQDQHCSIYLSRPNCCVGLQAGDEQCQSAREAEGLPPLLPRTLDRSSSASRQPEVRD